MNTIEISKTEYRNLRAAYNTLDAYADVRYLCPQCEEHFILRGFVCFGCGYDPFMDVQDNDTDREE